MRPKLGRSCSSIYLVPFISALFFNLPAQANPPAMLQAMLGSAATCLDLSSDWTPQYASIVGYWKANGLKGAIPNSTSIPATIGPNASASNANGTGMSYVDGKLGQAISFDGVDDSLVVSTSTPAALNLTANFTMAFWVNSAVANPTAYSIVSTGTQNNNKGYLVQWLFGYLYIERMISAGNEQIRTTSNTLLPANTWVHVAIVVGTTSVTIYINGSSVALTGSWTASINSYLGSNFFIGVRADGLQYWNGSLDEIAFWNVALAPSDIQTLYNRQSCGN